MATARQHIVDLVQRPRMKVLKRLGRRALSVPRLKPWLTLSLYLRFHSATPAGLVEWSMSRSRRGFRFVQVGSNDGKTGDPLFSAVTHGRTRGMLIEPIPALFAKLQQNYAGHPGLVFVNAAVADEEGVRDLHWVAPRDGDPMWAGLLGSFSRDIVLSHVDEMPDIAERVQTIPVPCRRLSSLLEEHRFGRVDLLHIDAEGADFLILKTIDFDASWCPRAILYEQKHLGDDRLRAIDMLQRAGYRTVDLGMDVFALRSGVGRFLARSSVWRKQR